MKLSTKIFSYDIVLDTGENIFMGTFLNPGFEDMVIDKNTDFYVDKSMLLSITNERIDTYDCFLCVSRFRRSGKTMAANMIAAYYSKGCDSHEIFADLKISKDLSFEKYINKYNVISIDMNGVLSMKGKMTTAQFYTKYIVPELMEEFPEVDIKEDDSLVEALISIYEATGERFVFIIDEYDAVFREERYSSDAEEYMRFLISLFKGSIGSSTIALAYLTGIMPIIKDKNQSGLNNFDEYTMVHAYEMAPYMGFTEDEVRSLAEKAEMDYHEMKRWYDGYTMEGIKIYSPKSIIDAIEDKECDYYWTQTCSYEVLTDYISMEFEGIKEDVISLLFGDSVPVNTRKFNNTMLKINSKDDVYTCLIQLGYLGHDSDEKTCFIPNKELRDMWALCMERAKGYEEIGRIIRKSEYLLDATWKMEEETVSAMFKKAHKEITKSIKTERGYDLKCAILLSYFNAQEYYRVICSELERSEEYAKVVFVPSVPNVPAMLVEFKKDNSLDIVLGNIKDREYKEALEKYGDNLLLVAISYDSKKMEYYSRIEKVKKESQE